MSVLLNISIADKYVPLEKKIRFRIYFQGNLRYFLQETDCFDEYSVIYDGGERTAILKNSPREPTVIEERTVRGVTGDDSEHALNKRKNYLVVESFC